MSNCSLETDGGKDLSSQASSDILIRAAHSDIGIVSPAALYVSERWREREIGKESKSDREGGREKE